MRVVIVCVLTALMVSSYFVVAFVRDDAEPCSAVRHVVTVYSGGSVIRQYEATGTIERLNHGWCRFFDALGRRHVLTRGEVVIETLRVDETTTEY